MKSDPIHVKGCHSRPKVGEARMFQDFSHEALMMLEKVVMIFEVERILV